MSIEALEREQAEVEEDFESLDAVPEERIDELEAELDLFTDIFGDYSDAEPLTDQLLVDEDDLVCWTCGGDVTTSQIQSMLGRLREVHREKIADRNDLDEHRGRISELETERDGLVDEVEALEDEIETLRTDDERDELIELRKEATQLEVDVGRLESDLAEVTDEIARIEDQVDTRDQLEAQRDELQEEIESLRTRIDRLEAEAIETFNDHMDTVLDLLEYDNLDRI